MEVIQNELFGKNEFVVKEERKINWTLVDSTKTIANFKCYYAFAVIKKEKRGSTKDLKIEAWYTPEIPISIGPKGYNQLPGLIIQLTENKTVFIAEKLEVMKKRKKIELPTSGKIINHDQYVEIFRERSAKADLQKRE
jgi:GLPGLI family protein